MYSVMTNRYLVAFTGLLIAINQLYTLASNHFIIFNNSWVAFDVFLASTLFLTSLFNNKYFYITTFVVCCLFLLLSVARFYHVHISLAYPLNALSFTRIFILAIALYSCLKGFKTSDSHTVIS